MLDIAFLFFKIRRTSQQTMGRFRPLAIKKKYGKKLKQNKQIPHWKRMMTGNGNNKWNNARRHWRRVKLNY